jgi:hypothetical protein
VALVVLTLKLGLDARHALKQEVVA